MLGETAYGTGTGRSKKDAEQSAACAALVHLDAGTVPQDLDTEPAFDGSVTSLDLQI